MGYGFDAINVVRNNRTLLKKRKFKDVKKLVLKSADKTEAQFKEVSSEELEVIKTRYEEKQKNPLGAKF